jgi:hypothetical protein
MDDADEEELDAEKDLKNSQESVDSNNLLSIIGALVAKGSIADIFAATQRPLPERPGQDPPR